MCASSHWFHFLKKFKLVEFFFCFFFLINQIINFAWQLVATIIHQSHLCPLPLSIQPIIWNYDHCLHLYPTPHTVCSFLNIWSSDWLLGFPCYVSVIKCRSSVSTNNEIELFDLRICNGSAKRYNNQLLFPIIKTSLGFQ